MASGDPTWPRGVDRIGGWLRRWAASATAPMSPMTALTLTPSAGWKAVARKVTSTGPMMKTTSSSMASSANAVFSSGEPPKRSVHRARTADPARLKPIPTPMAAAETHRQRPGHFDRRYQEGHAERS